MEGGVSTVGEGGGEKDLGSCREDLTGGLEGTLFRT